MYVIRENGHTKFEVNNMTITFKIKEKRKERGTSLRELEEITGIERGYLADLENNKIPADEVLFAEMVVIADALALKITDLYELGSIEIKGIGEF